MDKVRTYYDSIKANDTKNDVMLFAHQINENVIPFLVANEIEVNIDNIKSALFAKNDLVKVYMAQYIKSKVVREMPKGMMERTLETLENDFSAALVRLCLKGTKTHFKHVKYDEGAKVCVADFEAIEKAYSTYISDEAELVAYSRLQGAVAALNNFFWRGAPANWHTYFRVNNGSFEINDLLDIDYSYYATKSKK